MYANLGGKELLHFVYQDRLKNVFHYQIVNDPNGFEPQMLALTKWYTKAFWTPLNIEGYWAEPESFVSGTVKFKHWLTQEQANLAVIRAKRLNHQPLLTLINLEK